MKEMVEKRERYIISGAGLNVAGMFIVAGCVIEGDEAGGYTVVQGADNGAISTPPGPLPSGWHPFLGVVAVANQPAYDRLRKRFPDEQIRVSSGSDVERRN